MRGRGDPDMIVSWMTTNQCNLKCVHCYQDAEEATERELSTDEAKKMIDEIARTGFKIMIFSGGEPLLRPDIYELVAHAASRGPAPGVRQQRHAHHRRGGLPPEGRRRLRHGHLGGQPGCHQARQVPRPPERPRPHPGRHRGLQARRACPSSCTPPWSIGTGTRSAPSPISPNRLARRPTTSSS